MDEDATRTELYSSNLNDIDAKYYLDPLGIEALTTSATSTTCTGSSYKNDPTASGRQADSREKTVMLDIPPVVIVCGFCRTKTIK